MVKYEVLEDFPYSSDGRVDAVIHVRDLRESGTAAFMYFNERKGCYQILKGTFIGWPD